MTLCELFKLEPVPEFVTHGDCHPNNRLRTSSTKLMWQHFHDNGQWHDSAPATIVRSDLTRDDWQPWRAS